VKAESPQRTYGQFCGIAHALDLVGERWALLVVRDLLLGPKRFTDLQRSLPGIGTNILSARLRQLEQSGVVQRRALPPPAGSTVYELTDYGRDLEDILLALGRWGARSLGTRTPDQELRSGWVGVAMRAYANPAATAGLEASCELVLDHGVLRVQLLDGEARIGEGSSGAADLVIKTRDETLLGLLAGFLSPEDAIASGAISLEGDESLLPRLLEAFRFRLSGNGS
jgi:DNA-binding HxlR family transcriptional regulator/putative sterol carrier protein